MTPHAPCATQWKGMPGAEDAWLPTDGRMTLTCLVWGHRRYTADYVSPLLIAHEIQALKSASKSSSGVDMKVRGSAVSRQVTATYQRMHTGLDGVHAS